MRAPESTVSNFEEQMVMDVNLHVSFVVCQSYIPTSIPISCLARIHYKLLDSPKSKVSFRPILP